MNSFAVTNRPLTPTYVHQGTTAAAVVSDNKMGLSESLDPWLSNVSDCVLASEGYYCDLTGDVMCLGKEVREYAQLINIVILSGVLSLFGIVTNVIHLIVFFRMGFKETINISLFALSVSDLGASAMLVWVTLCFNPLLRRSKAALDFDEIYYYTGSFPRETFMMITAFITVFISTERYLCIFFPLKIKSIMTTKLVTSIIVAIYVINTASFFHAYSIVRFDWWWDPRKNRSVISAFYDDNFRPFEEGNRTIYTIYTFLCYLIVSSCTALFAWKLKLKGKWRRSVSGQRDTTSNVRDRQIIKTVTFVAVIFITCYSPGIGLTGLMYASPNVDICQRYHNLYVVVESITTSIGAINSSVNIFVYYNMMSKYRAVFHALFIKSGKV